MADDIRLKMQIEAVNRATADLKKVQGDLKAIEKELNSNSKASKLSAQSFKNFGDSMKRVGSGMSTYITLPILAAGGAMIKLASDGEETRSKYDTIFKDMVAGANDVADNFARDYGLAGATSRKLLGDTSDLLTGLNFTQESALSLSTQVNALGVDLASFTNFSGGAEGASAALTKALLGEREGLKSLGIAISEEQVKAQVLKNTKAGLVFETEMQAKAQATLDLAMQQSKNAIGDYARTSDSAANQARLFKENLKELGETFGTKLLPIFTDAIGWLNEVVLKFTSMSDASQNIILITLGVIAALGPLISIIGNVSTAIGGLTVTMNFLAKNQIIIVIAAIAALVAGLIWLWKNSDEVNQYITESLGVLFAFFTDTWEGIKTAVVAAFNYIKDVGIIIWDVIAGFITDTMATIQSVIQAGGDLISGIWSTIWGGVKSVVSTVWGGIESLVVGGVNAVISAINLLIDGLNKLPGVAIPAFDKVRTSADKAADATRNAQILQDKFGTSSPTDLVFDTILPQKAFGGRVEKNKPVIVGEGGAEVFMPSASGNIVPNNQFGSSINVQNLIGTVVVQNEADENRLIEKIKQVLTRDMQLKSIGSNA